MNNYTYIYTCRNISSTITTSGHSSLEKYTSQHIDPHSSAITVFLSRSPGLLNRGPGGPASAGTCSHSSIFSLTDLNFLSPGLYNNLTSTYFLGAWQFHTQFNPSTVKVAPWYLRPDAPVIYSGAFLLMTARPGSTEYGERFYSPYFLLHSYSEWHLWRSKLCVKYISLKIFVFYRTLFKYTKKKLHQKFKYKLKHNFENSKHKISLEMCTYR